MKKIVPPVGCNASDISYSNDMKTQLREKLARAKIFLDSWLGKNQKYSGERIKIPL